MKYLKPTAEFTQPLPRGIIGFILGGIGQGFPGGGTIGVPGVIEAGEAKVHMTTVLAKQAEEGHNFEGFARSTLPPTITFDNEMEYWSADFALSYSCCLCQRISFRSFAGLRWADVQDSGEISLGSLLIGGWLGSSWCDLGAAAGVSGFTTQPTYGLRQEQEHKIIGLRVGAASDYWVSDCLSVGGHLGATIGLAEVDRLVAIFISNQAERIDIIRVTSETECSGMLGVGGEFGGRYHFCFSGFQSHIDLKYFADAWHPLSPVGPNLVGFLSWNSGFVIHGVKLGLGASF